MSDDGGSGRQKQDRNSTGSGLLLWAGLIVATGLLLIFLVTPYFQRELSPSDLKDLIAASQYVEKGGKPKEGAIGYIDVRDKDKAYRYSNLQKPVIHDRSITGTVDVVELQPQGAQGKLHPGSKPWTEAASFRTNIDASGPFVTKSSSCYKTATSISATRAPKLRSISTRRGFCSGW